MFSNVQRRRLGHLLGPELPGRHPRPRLPRRQRRTPPAPGSRSSAAHGHDADEPAVTFAVGGLTIVRTRAAAVGRHPARQQLHRQLVAPLFDAALLGAQATVYRTTAMRVNTATFGETTATSPSSPPTPTARSWADGGRRPGQHRRPPGLGRERQQRHRHPRLPPDLDRAQRHQHPAPGRLDRWTPIFTPRAAGQLVGLRPVADSKALAGTRYGSATASVSPLSAIANGGGGNWYNLTCAAPVREPSTTAGTSPRPTVSPATTAAPSSSTTTPSPSASSFRCGAS
jgi:hypothetical protein